MNYKYHEEDKVASRWLEEQEFICVECDNSKKLKNMIVLSSGEMICKNCDIDWGTT